MDEIIEAIRDLFLHIDSASTKKELTSVSTEKRVEKYIDRTAGGAAAGIVAGGAIGAIGGPFGLLIGVILGGLFGATVGAANKIRQFVKEIWRAPHEILLELPGGSEASVVTLAFGYALQDSLLEVRDKEKEDFDPNLFQARLEAYYKQYKRQITPEIQHILDNATSESESYEVVIKLIG
jgi:hypothetical protein